MGRRFKFKHIRRLPKQNAESLLSNLDRNFNHYCTTKDRFGYQFRSTKQKQKFLNQVKLDQQVLELVGLTDKCDWIKIYSRLMFDDISVVDFIRVILDGYICYDDRIKSYIDDRLKLNDQKYPKEWKKTVDKIISREELILSILNPQYLEETEVNTLFDLIENFESDITVNRS